MGRFVVDWEELLVNCTVLMSLAVVVGAELRVMSVVVVMVVVTVVVVVVAVVVELVVVVVDGGIVLLKTEKGIRIFIFFSPVQKYMDGEIYISTQI